MYNNNIIFKSTGIAALMMVSVTPAFATGKKDRAREAIAAASAKIDAANKVGASGDVPRLQAEAQAALRTAQEELANGKKDAAIADANHASELADTAIGIAHRNQLDSERAANANATEAATAAQAQAAEAARAEAAAANARADAAQQQAQAAQAEAAAARAQPPVIVAPQPVATTVTTETVKDTTPAPTTVQHKKVVHHVVHRAPTKALVREKTSTTVTTSN